MTDSIESMDLPAGTAEERILKAIAIAVEYGGMDGAHHKAWTIDQMVRALTGCPMIQQADTDVHGKPYIRHVQGESTEYRQVVDAACDGENGPGTYEWEPGIAP